MAQVTNLFNSRPLTRKEALTAMAVSAMGVTGSLCFGQARTGQDSRSISVDQLEPGIQKELLSGTYAKAIARAYEVTLDYECDFSEDLAKKGLSEAWVAMPKAVRAPGQFPLEQSGTSLLADRNSANSAGQAMREVTSENGQTTVLVGKVTPDHPVARCHIKVITCQMAASRDSINNPSSPDTLSASSREAYLDPEFVPNPGMNILKCPELTNLINRLDLKIRPGEGTTEFAYRVGETLLKDGFKYGPNTKIDLATTIAAKGGICGPLGCLNTAILRYNKIPASLNSLLVIMAKGPNFANANSDIHVHTQVWDDKRRVWVHSDLAQMLGRGIQNLPANFGRSVPIDTTNDNWIPVVFMRRGRANWVKLAGYESKQIFIPTTSAMLCIDAEGHVINADRRPQIQIKSRSIVSINGVGFANKGK